MRVLDFNPLTSVGDNRRSHFKDEISAFRNSDAEFAEIELLDGFGSESSREMCKKIASELGFENITFHIRCRKLYAVKH